MKKPLRIALGIAIAAIGLACFASSFFAGKPWFPFPGKGDALAACGWSLMAIAISILPGLRTARSICAGLACALLGVGITALFIDFSQIFMLRLDLAGSLLFLAALAIDGLASYIAHKNKKHPPQEAPQ